MGSVPQNNANKAIHTGMSLCVCVGFLDEPSGATKQQQQHLGRFTTFGKKIANSKTILKTILIADWITCSKDTPTHTHTHTHQSMVVIQKCCSEFFHEKLAEKAVCSWSRLWNSTLIGFDSIVSWFNIIQVKTGSATKFDFVNQRSSEKYILLFNYACVQRDPILPIFDFRFTKLKHEDLRVLHVVVVVVILRSTKWSTLNCSALRSERLSSNRSIRYYHSVVWSSLIENKLDWFFSRLLSWNFAAYLNQFVFF